MSESQVTIALLVDASQTEAEIADTQAKIDGVVAAWKNHRREILQGLAVVNQMVAIVAQIASKTLDDVGRAMLKILQSLLSVINATVSTIIATAAAYAATGILAPVAAILAAFATGLSIGQTASVIATEGRVMMELAAIQTRLTQAERTASAKARLYSGGI